MAAALAFVAGSLGVLGFAALAPRPARPRSGGGDRVPRLLRIAMRAGWPAAQVRAPGDLAGRIEAAGRPGGVGERELMAAKLAAAAVCGALGLLVSGAAPGRLGSLLTVGAPAAGFLAPDLWLARLAAQRARRVRRELPGMLDLLRVTVDAGLSPAAALRAVGGRTRGPLAREWLAAAREAELGVPLAQALERMNMTTPLPEVRALTAALQRAARHGAPLGQTLAAQARDTRFALRRRVQEDAARAGPKIQLVVALLLVPSVLLLVAASLAAALLDGSALPA
jgi:tight adherence protein C